MKPAINHRIIILTLTLTLLCACGNREHPEEALRPNIQLVITDDQSWLHAGSYGDNYNLDKPPPEKKQEEK